MHQYFDVLSVVRGGFFEKFVCLLPGYHLLAVAVGLCVFGDVNFVVFYAIGDGFEGGRDPPVTAEFGDVVEFEAFLQHQLLEAVDRYSVGGQSAQSKHLLNVRDGTIVACLSQELHEVFDRALPLHVAAHLSHALQQTGLLVVDGHRHMVQQLVDAVVVLVLIHLLDLLDLLQIVFRVGATHQNGYFHPIDFALFVG